MTEPTHLPERMKLYTKGQITWPEPNLKRRCDACDHFEPQDKGKKGRCALVEKMTRTAGNLFEGHKAIACPKFRPRGTA